MADSIASQAPAWLAGRKILIAALILGAITAGLIVAFLATRDDADVVSPIQTEMVEVVVANREIEAGTVITRAMLEVRELPREAVITGAATELSEVEGETARYPLVAGEQINVGRLVEGSPSRALSFTIPDGLRGFTIPVDVKLSPVALTVPGDFVDVIAVFGLVETLEDGVVRAVKIDGGDQLNSSVTVYQNIQVLAIDRNFVNRGVEYDETTRGAMKEEAGVSYVTLAVTPEQAQQLALISEDGQLRLSLRGFGDDASDPIEPTDEPFNIPGLAEEPAQASQQQ